MFNSCCAIKGIFLKCLHLWIFFNAIVFRFRFVFLNTSPQIHSTCASTCRECWFKKIWVFQGGHLFSLHWSVPLMCMGRLIPRSSAAVQNFTPYAPVKNVLKPHPGNNFLFIYFFFKEARLSHDLLWTTPARLGGSSFPFRLVSCSEFTVAVHTSKTSCTFNPPPKGSSSASHGPSLFTVQWFIETISLQTFFGGCSANMSHL